MKTFKNIFGNIAAIAYFCLCMLLTMGLLLIFPLMFPSEVSSILDSGFSGPNNSMAFVALCSLFVGISMLIPTFRKMYYVLPWLNAYVRVLFIDMVILCIGVTILNYGYQEVNEQRHKLFFILMIVQLIVCRLAVCIYYKLRPIKCIEQR